MFIYARNGCKIAEKAGIDEKSCSIHKELEELCLAVLANRCLNFQF